MAARCASACDKCCAVGLPEQFTNTSDRAEGGPRTIRSESTALSFHRRGNLEQNRKSLNTPTYLGKFTVKCWVVFDGTNYVSVS